MPQQQDPVMDDTTRENVEKEYLEAKTALWAAWAAVTQHENARVVAHAAQANAQARVSRLEALLVAHHASKRQ